jgi:hypothetical protein
VQFSWAETDEAALEGCRVWKGAQPQEYYTDDWHRPTDRYRHGEETVSDGADPRRAIEIYAGRVLPALAKATAR